MFEYTKNNHFAYGYNNIWFTNRKGESDVFTCKYGKCFNKLSFRESNRNAAVLISKNKNPIRLLISGGGDSEIMARSFIDANIKFDAAIMRYKVANRIVNEYDIIYAINFCRNNNIVYKFYDLNILDGNWDFDYTIIQSAQANNPHIFSHMWLMKKVCDDGFIPVVGQGDPFMYYLNGNLIFRERENICSWYKFVINNDLQAIPAFYHYTPEQLYAFISDCPIPENNTNEVCKQQFYKQCYPEYIIRNKRTGTENLTNLSLIETQLDPMALFCKEEYRLEYKQIKEMLIA